MIAQRDVTLVLETMQEVHEALNLQHFKCIEIRLSGLVLLQIWHPDVTIDQSACVDIRDYRRRLQQHVSTSAYSGVWIDFVFVAIMFALVIVIMCHLFKLSYYLID